MAVRLIDDDDDDEGTPLDATSAKTELKTRVQDLIGALVGAWTSARSSTGADKGCGVCGKEATKLRAAGARASST